jgi:hypothetical protein
MMREKLDYIHANPVKRGYVNLPQHWRYRVPVIMQVKLGCWRLIYGEMGRWSVWGCIPKPERGNDEKVQEQKR